MRIRELREALKPPMTQQQLADIMGVDRSSVARWEAVGGGVRKNMPSIKKLPLLRKTLKCRRIEELYDDEERKEMGLD